MSINYSDLTDERIFDYFRMMSGNYRRTRSEKDRKQYKQHLICMMKVLLIRWGETKL